MVLSGSWRLSWRAYVHVTCVACVVSCDPGPQWEPENMSFLDVGEMDGAAWRTLHAEISDGERGETVDRVADLTVFRARFSSGEIMRRQPDYGLNEHRSRFNPKAISSRITLQQIAGWTITLPPCQSALNPRAIFSDSIFVPLLLTWTEFYELKSILWPLFRAERISLTVELWIGVELSIFLLFYLLSGDSGRRCKFFAFDN